MIILYNIHVVDSFAATHALLGYIWTYSKLVMCFYVYIRILSSTPIPIHSHSHADCHFDTEFKYVRNMPYTFPLPLTTHWAHLRARLQKHQRTVGR